MELREARFAGLAQTSGLEVCDAPKGQGFRPARDSHGGREVTPHPSRSD